MKNLCSAVVFVALLIFATHSSGGQYLKEAPPFLSPCYIHGTNVNDHCLAHSIENVFHNWKDGIPGLANVGSIDPFRVKKVRLSQRTENIADIQVELSNVVAHGLSKIKVLKSFVNETDHTFTFHIHLPEVKIESDYKIKGRILILDLDSNGTTKTAMTDLHYVLTAKTKLVKTGDEYFIDILSLSSEIQSIGSFHVHFTNLFNGNKELEDSANELFNQNWREFFQVLRPALIQTLDTVTHDRYKKIFAYIPARFFFADLP